VELAHTRGVLTAASLMVAGDAAADAIARARALPRLRVGLHLVLVDGRPMLPPERIPDLVDGRGWLRSDPVSQGARIFMRPRVRAQAAAEIAAQYEAFGASGLALDHVNAHHHFHLHPTIGALAIAIGARFGLAAMRLPFEPVAVLDRVEPGGAHRRNVVVAPWLALLARRLRTRGIAAPDQVFGLAWSGAMTETRVAGVLRTLPAGLTEIYLHPATADHFAGAAGRYRYADELAALTSARIADLVAASKARTGGYADLRT
jgi:hopanoid biosynthesis associated protein HpnK